MAVASLLAKEGLTTCLLEAQESLGGRVKDYQWGDSLIQVGAEELHGITSQYHTMLVNNKVSLYNLEEEKDSLYQIGNQLIGEQ